MATTTTAKEDDDNDKQMTSTTPPPPTTTTATTSATTPTPPTQPPATPNKLKDLPPAIQDRQSSGGDESIVSSTSFNPAEPSTNTHFLPLPNPSTNKSRSSFILSEDELPPEIANADISIARDGSFVETSSGAAARELKRRYDEQLGVGSSAKGSYAISPYAITAFVNQHGKQMYRVGHRELSPPALSSEDVDRRAFIQPRSSQSTRTTKSSGSPGPTKRRSRMSMHTFLPPTLFKSSHASTSTLPKLPASNTIPPPPLLPPQSHQQPIVPPVSVPSPQLVDEPADSPPNRRLRKTRSLSNMFGMANLQNPNVGTIPSNPPPQIVQGPTIPNLAVGRPHAHSVTGADIPRSTLQHSDIVTTITTGLASMDSISSRIEQPLPPPPPTRDVFSDVMGWNVETSSETGSFDDSSHYGSGGFGWRPDVNVSGSRASSSSHNQGCSRMHQGLGVKNPFGRDVYFDPPVMRERERGRERSWSQSSGKGLDVDVDGQGSLGLDMERGNGEVWDADEEKGYRYTDHLKINNGPVLREMQSFESGLTARADPISRLAGAKGKEREKLTIKTSEAISESEPEVDAAIVSAAVDGYESSGSSSPGSTFPPSTPVPTRQTLPIHIRHTSISAPVQLFSQEAQSPSPETSSHSRYSTQVFDVLHSYRGIPLLDKLSEDTECPETTVIRLSGRNELNAAPKDDPRFVMWGEVWSGFGPSEEDGASVDVNASIGGISRFTSSAIGADTVSSHGSMVVQGPTDQTLGSKKGKKGSMSLTGPGTQQALTTITTASATTLSAASLTSSIHSVPAWSATQKTDNSPPVPRPRPPPPPHLGHPSNGETPRKVLIAATIERWIAQLTSELNYDELLIFFLTYRTYVSAIDLCHLLICRFHWALESSSSSPPSVAGSARSSYCLSSNSRTGNGLGFGDNLTANDNLNNDDMVKRIVRVRTFIAIRYWLLTFFAIDFVPNRELRILFGNWLNTLAKDPTLHGKKDIMDIVKKLKKVANDCIDLQTSKPRASGLPQPRTSSSRRASNNQSRKSDPSGGVDESSDVDLDFLPDSGAALASHPQPFGAAGKGPGMSPSSAADAAILQQPLHLAILSQPQSTELTSSSSSATLRPHNGVFVPSPSTLPFHHKPLSRAFVNTIGRLGRWKRVLNPRNAAGAGGNSRSHMTPADPFDVSPFNLESNATGDLLMVKGGVEQYLKMIDQHSTTNPSSLASSLASSTTSSINSGSVRSLSHPSSPNMISPAISLPGTPGVIAMDIGNVHGGVITSVPSTVPVSPSASGTGDRDGGERLGVVSEEPEDQDDAEVPPRIAVDEDPNPAPLDDTQRTRSLVLDAGDVIKEVQDFADADVEVETVPTEENVSGGEADTTLHPIDLPTDEEASLQSDSRPSSPESYDSEKSRRQAHESMMSGPSTEPPASLPPSSVSGHSGTRGLTRGGYQHRFQHDAYWDSPDNGQRSDRSWQIDVVSIDELDLSDMSSSGDEGDAGKLGAGTSDSVVPPGLRRLPKKLPLRREFEFVRPESVSSFSATGGHASIISAASSSIASSNATDDANGSRHASGTGTEDDDQPGLGRGILQWQVNAIVDSLSDDEDAGDVDAALNRLEGRINQTQRKLKQSKVDTWVKSIRERMANGLYGDEKPRFPVDDSDEDEGSGENEVDEFGVVGPSQPVNATEQHTVQRMSVDVKRASRSSSANDGLSPDVETPMAQTYSSNATRSGPGSPMMGADSIPAIEDVVPLEILRSRVPTRPSTSTSSRVGSPASRRVRSPPPSTFGVPAKAHRSFLLTVKTGPLAEHLATIERELFIGLKFEEFVDDNWMESVEESSILDWAQYLKDRARYRAEGRVTPKTGALVAFRGRFNLFAKFVASEIVMTHPNERLNLVSKFIRVAWKLYERGAFNTLISLLAGLRSEWVARAVGKRWEKLGSWETRMYRDLRLVTSVSGDFRYLRQEVEAAIEAEPISANPRDSSAAGADASPMGKGKGEGKIQPRTACIPFLGQYLSQLYRHSQLPDLIDPTAPNESVRIDPETNTFEPPAHPEVFTALAPLPPSMQLEPLINIQKQRRIAGVIKSLVTGQHLASKLQFPIDKKLFQRCLRLKALDEDTLIRVYAMYPD